MSAKRLYSGLFVTLEGADRTGKSTQACLLSDALTKLMGQPTLNVCFPDRSTPIGSFLNGYLTGSSDVSPHTLHLLFTANRWEKQDEIREALTKGRCVVADRYSYSGIAYTAAKPPPTPSWQWCCDMERGLVEPDLVICLTPDSFDHLKDREGYGKERYETDDFQQRVLENYIRLSKDAKCRDYEELGIDRTQPPSQMWHFVQATNKNVEEVHECIMKIIHERVKSLQS